MASSFSLVLTPFFWLLLWLLVSQLPFVLLEEHRCRGLSLLLRPSLARGDADLATEMGLENPGHAEGLVAAAFFARAGTPCS
jgi:hypothetical protein